MIKLPALVALVAEVRSLAMESPTNRYIPAVEREAATLSQKHDMGVVCFYASGDNENGSCGCIIGQALKNLGVNTAELDAVAAAKLAAAGVGNVYRYFDREQADAGDKRLSWLISVQSQQDTAATWETAIKAADTLNPIPSERATVTDAEIVKALKPFLSADDRAALSARLDGKYL